MLLLPQPHEYLVYPTGTPTSYAGLPIHGNVLFIPLMNALHTLLKFLIPMLVFHTPLMGTVYFLLNL